MYNEIVSVTSEMDEMLRERTEVTVDPAVVIVLDASDITGDVIL